MPFPRFARRLFENEGAGPLLNKDIIPCHAATHAANGSDPISPASVGAASSGDLEALRTAMETMIGALSAQMEKFADPWTLFPPRVPIAVDGVTFPEGENVRHPIMPGETEPRLDWFICDGGSDGKGGTVPDLRGRMILCASDTHQVGDTGGSETHEHSLSGTVGATTLSVAQMPTHNHTGNWSTGWANTGRPGELALANKGQDVFLSVPYNGSSQGHTHTFSASTAAADNLPPYYAATYIMRCA